MSSGSTSPPSGSPLGESHLLGKYRLTEELGRGGMGVVVAAEDTILQRKVAIKLLAPEVARTAEARERFLREARAVAPLNHPNVVMIHEINEHDGHCYIVTELATGGSLEAALERQGRMPWQAATRAIADACRGVGAAHAAGLIHRDVKPANLLCCGETTIKVGDFGLAKPGKEATALTAKGIVYGTPNFMSPEQWRAEPLTELTDVYSLGATYYALLTGKSPHSELDALQVMYACCNQPPPDPRDVCSDVPQACAQIVATAMARNRSQRYPSCAAMLKDLEGLIAVPLNEQPTLPVIPPPPLIVQRRGISRRRWLALGTGALLVTAGAAAVITFQRGPTGWTDLYDGRSLTGWWRRSGDKGRWSVEDGVLIGRGPESYLYTDRQDFANFHCRAEVMFNAAANAGLFFRCRPDYGLPIGYEAQLAAGSFGQLHRLLNDHGQAESQSGEGRIVPADTWLTLDVLADGPSIIVRYQDQIVSELQEQSTTDARIPGHGAIALQAFDADTVLKVRRVQIRELP
jgi:serine/threonine protein kinase